MSRPFPRLVAAVLLAGAALLGLPAATASAHAALVSSEPAANSVVATAPTAIVLTFDEPIESSLSDIQLFDAQRKPIAVGAPASGATEAAVTVSLPALADGLYAVVWRVTSADGHPVDGAFAFQVGSGDAVDGQALVDQVRNGSSDPQVDRLYTLARFLALAGALVLLGTGWWSLQGKPALGESLAVRRVLYTAVTALALGALGTFGLFGAKAAGGGLRDAVSPSTWGDIVGTDTGNMLLARLVLVVVLVVLLVRCRPASPAWQAVSLFIGLATLVTFSGAGHPNSLDPRAFWIAVDVAHLAAIAVWMGGLVAIAAAGRAWLTEPEAVRPVQRFSTLSAVAVPVIVVTGLAQTWKLAGSLDDVSATTWGRLLLGKVMVVVAIVALAGVSRWLLQHDGAASIRRTVVAEAVLGLLVIGLAAGMVSQAPRPGVPSREFSQTVTASGVLASVEIQPGRVGGNQLHVYITPPGGSLTPVTAVTARVELTSAGIPFSPVQLTTVGPNHYLGQITFPEGGDWTLELIVQVTASQSVLLKTTVPIP